MRDEGTLTQDASRITFPRIVFYSIQPDSISQTDPPMPDLEKAQTYMREQAIDGWLLYDFRESNPVFWYLLGMKQQTTRRNYLVIPARGPARPGCWRTASTSSCSKTRVFR